MTMTFDNTELQTLLKGAKRVAYVNGSKEAQCHAAYITTLPKSKGGRATTYGMVKDGVTSTHALSVATDKENSSTIIAVANIDYLLGILKTHSSPVKLTNIDNKLVVKSKGKQTTVLSSLDSLAYPAGSRLTVAEQAKNAQEVITRWQPDGSYVDTKGRIHHASVMGWFDKALLLNALSVASLNGQNSSNVRLHGRDGKTFITCGDTVKGETSTCISENWESSYDITFGGGLENVLGLFPNDKVLMTMWDLRDYGGRFILGLSSDKAWIEDGFGIMQVGSEYGH